MSKPAPSEPPSDLVRGRCLCGAVGVTVEGPRRAIEACHCSKCQQWTGGPYLGVSGQRFSVHGLDQVQVFRSSAWAERAFCRQCGSTLWFHFIPGDHRSFAAGLFRLSSDFVLGQQIFIDEKPGWYDFAQQTAMKSGPEIIGEARAAGFELGESTSDD